jgi:hypothetical protein
MVTEKTEVKSCERCLRQAVCIIYHGYSQLELQFGNPRPANPVELMHNIRESLALKCGFYLASEGTNQED